MDTRAVSRTLLALLVVTLTANPASGQATACGTMPAIDAYVEAYAAMAAFDGVVLIAETDEVVYLCAYGMGDYRFGRPMKTETRFRVASLSKQFTDAAIGRLVDAGRLSLDDTLSQFLPDFPEANRITIRQLVEHTSGVAHTNRLDWMDMREAMTLDEILSELGKEPLQFDPGTDNAYSNGGYALLAAVIEQLSGMEFGAYVDKTFSHAGYASVGHEEPFDVVSDMAYRYAPGPEYGHRIEAPLYITANRIGGGSLYANAEDLWRFFRDTYEEEFLSSATTKELFPKPSDGDVLITGRSPGTLAQVYLNFNTGLSVVTLSSSAAWPGSFNADIGAIYQGAQPDLTSFEVDTTQLTATDLARYTGAFKAERFGWQVTIANGPSNLVYVQGDIRSAFGRTSSGEFHLPLYDWLCTYEVDGAGFTCRQRDPDAEIRFVFKRGE